MGHFTVHINIDAQLKSSMEQVSRELGLSTTEAFIIFAAKAAREKRIPFEVAIDPFYSDENMARLRNSISRGVEAAEGTISGAEVRHESAV